MKLGVTTICIAGRRHHDFVIISDCRLVSAIGSGWWWLLLLSLFLLKGCSADYVVGDNVMMSATTCGT
jgi:hypothetical protein